MTKRLNELKYIPYPGKDQWHSTEAHQPASSRDTPKNSLQMMPKQIIIFFLSVLEMLRQKYIQKKKKKERERAVQTLTHRTYPPYVAPPKSNMGALIVSEVN